MAMVLSKSQMIDLCSTDLTQSSAAPWSATLTLMTLAREATSFLSQPATPVVALLAASSESLQHLPSEAKLQSVPSSQSSESSNLPQTKHTPCICMEENTRIRR